MPLHFSTSNEKKSKIDLLFFSLLLNALIPFPKILLQTYSLSLPPLSQAPRCSSRKGEMNYQFWLAHPDSAPLVIHLADIFDLHSISEVVHSAPAVSRIPIIFNFVLPLLFKEKYKLYITYNNCIIQSALLETWNNRTAGIIFMRKFDFISHHLCCPCLQRISKGTGAKENCKWSGRFIVKTSS